MRDHKGNNKCFLMPNVFKHFDRVLNIIIVILGCLAVYHMFFVQKSPEEQKESLLSEAEAAFGESSIISVSGKTSSSGQLVYTLSGIVPVTFEQLTEDVLKSDVPVLLMVYTSWCPYCNKLFPEVSKIAQEQQGNLKVVAVSVDKSKEAFRTYTNSHSSPPPFPAYYLGAGNDYDRLINYLQLTGFNFKGGIPFMAFFSQGKPAGQIGGYVEKEKIDQIIQQIYATRSSQSKPTL